MLPSERVRGLKASSIAGVINDKALRQILNAFVGATGLRASVVTPDGKPLIVPPEEVAPQPEFCRMIQSSAKGQRRCQGSYERAGMQAAQYGEPYIFRCHAGLILWAAPLMLKRRLLATAICGQVLMWEPEDFFWIEITESTKDLDLNLPKLIDAARRLPVVSGKRVQYAAELLFAVSSFMMRTQMITLRQRERIWRQQTKLGEAIEVKKQLEDLLYGTAGSNTRLYPLDKEVELVRRVKLRDRTGAEKILNDILADLVLGNAAQPTVLRARILELMVVLSRGAVEGGANLQDLLDVNYQYMTRLVGAQSIEELCYLMLQVMENFLDRVGQGTKHRQIISRVTRHIEENIARVITLEELARVVHLSPGYLSHLFKKELNMSVVDYITRARIERAKHLLEDPQSRVTEVARMVGYTDPSYFCKVFKREVGLTPTEYAHGVLAVTEAGGE